jgi:hypothetical protein
VARHAADRRSPAAGSLWVESTTWAVEGAGGRSPNHARTDQPAIRVPYCQPFCNEPRVKQPTYCQAPCNEPLVSLPRGVQRNSRHRPPLPSCAPNNYLAVAMSSKELV